MILDAQGRRTTNFFLTGGAPERRIVDPDATWDGAAFVVAWHEFPSEKRGACPSDVVFAARVSPDGKPLGEATRISGALAGPASEATVASDGAGTTLIAYEKHPETGDVPIRIGFRLLCAAP